jgi:PKD repeat protein
MSTWYARNRGGHAALAVGALAAALAACADQAERPTAPRIGGRPSAATTVAARSRWTPPRGADGAYLLPKVCDVFIGEAPSLAPDPEKYAHQLHVVVPANAVVRVVRKSDHPGATFADYPAGIAEDALVDGGRTFQCNSEDPQNPGHWVVEPVTAHAGKGDGPQLNTDGVTLDLNGFSIKADPNAERLLVPSPHTGPMDNIGPSVGGSRQTLTNSSTTDVSVISGFGHNIDVEADHPSVLGKRLADGRFNIEATGGFGVRLSSGIITVANVKSVDFTKEDGVAVGVGFELRNCVAGSEARIRNNHFVGNGEGVLVRRCSNSTITLEGNFISSPGGVGIATREVVGSAATPVTFRGNTIDLSYPGQAVVGPTGIAWALGSDRLTITGNTIRSFPRYVVDPEEPANACGIEITSGTSANIPDPDVLIATNDIERDTSEPIAPQVCGSRAANVKPVAGFTHACSLLACSFTSTSTDSDGIASYAWTLGDGTTSTARNPSRTYAQAGSYTVSLTVTDGRGGVSTAATRTVTVTAANVAPVAAFDSVSATRFTVGFADRSTDADGNATITRWAWSFGDGGTSTVQHPSRTYAQPGTYTVTLTVTDNQGASSQLASRAVTISPDIQLSGAYVSSGTRRVDLTWSAAWGSEVRVFRDRGRLADATTPLTTTVDDGAHPDPTPARDWFTYKLCSLPKAEGGDGKCSNVIQVDARR